MLRTLPDIKKLFAKEGYTVIDKSYTHSKQKIKYICPNGHTHSVRLDHWVRGIRCPFCSNKFKKSISYIKPFFEKEGYTLISEKYTDAFGKLECRCPEGHVFYTSWHNWSSGNHRCPLCKGGTKKDVTTVVKVLKKEGYTLNDTYVNTNLPVKCVCPQGHEYSVSIGNFTSKKSRCTVCSGNGASSCEHILRDFLRSIGIVFETNVRSLISPFEIDILISDKKLCIEYCGLYWHSENKGKNKFYHLNKMKACNDLGYRLLTIFEDEMLFKNEIVFSRLRSILGIIDVTKVIYARKCKISIISASKAREFCNNHHIQGYGGGASIKLGAFFERTLVAVMTFAKPSIAKGSKIVDGVFELHRFCTLKNYRIVGVASKLFSFFVNNFKFSKIFSYADRRWSEGQLYEVLGFSLVGDTGPNYWYVKNKKRINRFALRKRAEDNQSLTEWENRQLEGYDRIWDCGSLKYEYIR